MISIPIYFVYISRMDKVLEGKASIIDLTSYYVEKIKNIVNKKSIKKGGGTSVVTTTAMSMSIIQSQLTTIGLR